MTNQTLGTLLRHLLELLDGDLEVTYRSIGLDYRPRFTPVMRVLNNIGSATIREIANHTTLSHSALSQTISEMTKRGLVAVEKGQDGRERIVALTDRAKSILPQLEECWDATNAAADELMSEVGAPLASIISDAIAALEQRPFFDRIAEKRQGSAERSRLDAAHRTTSQTAKIV